MNGIDKLPAEVITKILTNLSFSEISLCRLVCKNWNMMIQNPHFWQLRIYVILKSSSMANFVLSLVGGGMDNLVRLSYYLDQKDGDLIKNSCFTLGRASWDKIIGPYKVSSDQVVKTCNKRFLRIQKLLLSDVPITQKLVTECNVYLVWSVWISRTQDFPCTFSARLINRHNKIITTLACENPSRTWTKLTKRFLLTEKIDLTQVYYKEVGYRLSSEDSSFTGVQIFNPKIYIEIFELAQDGC